MEMRTEQEMMDLIIGVAAADERIRAVRMEGSRANPAVPKDQYQDYDISYYVVDIEPFENNDIVKERGRAHARFSYRFVPTRCMGI